MESSSEYICTLKNGLKLSAEVLMRNFCTYLLNYIAWKMIVVCILLVCSDCTWEILLLASLDFVFWGIYFFHACCCSLL